MGTEVLLEEVKEVGEVVEAVDVLLDVLGEQEVDSLHVIGVGLAHEELGRWGLGDLGIGHSVSYIFDFQN
jgi:hypothetical protein